MISLRSSMKRIEGHWYINKYIIEGNDSTQVYKDRYTSQIRFILENQFEYHDLYNRYSIDTDSEHGFYIGYWNIIKDKLYLDYDVVQLERDSIFFYPFNANDEIIFEIKKLSNKKLNIESTINNLDFRIELEKNK